TQAIPRTTRTASATPTSARSARAARTRTTSSGVSGRDSESLPRPHELRQKVGDAQRGNASPDVGEAVRENQLVAEEHTAAGVDDVRGVAVALVRRGSEERLAEATDDARRLLEIEQDRPEHVLPERTDA